LDMIWDYRNGYYVSEYCAPLRYRIRRFLETRFIPAVKLTAGFVLLAVLLTLRQLCRGMAWVGSYAREAIRMDIPGRFVRGILRAARLREPWEVILVGLPVILIAGAGAILLVAVALAGGGAERLVAWYETDEFGGAV